MEVVPAGVPGVLPETAPRRSPAPAGNGKQPGPVTVEAVREFYAADLEAGRMPSIRQIKREWRVGYPAASELRDHLEAALTEP